MHLAIYRQREDVEAVVHAHPPVATAFACSGRALDEPLCAEAIMTLGPVPLAHYATTGTAEVGESLAELIAEHESILMANHGAVSYGKSLLEAFQRMETLEHFAHVCLVSHQLGSGSPLQQEQVLQLLRAKVERRSKHFKESADTINEMLKSSQATPELRAAAKYEYADLMDEQSKTLDAASS